MEPEIACEKNRMAFKSKTYGKTLPSEKAHLLKYLFLIVITTTVH